MPNILVHGDVDRMEAFFKPLEESGDIRIINAVLRPDVYGRVEPTPEMRVVLDKEGAVPPENVDFDIETSFDHTTLPEEQLAHWKEHVGQEEIPPEERGTEQEELPADNPPAVEAPEPDVSGSEEMATLIASGSSEPAGGVLDQKLGRHWTSPTSRGYKG